MIINFCTGFQISSGAFENILKKRYYGQCLIMNMWYFVKAQLSSRYCSVFTYHVHSRCSCFVASFSSTIFITMATPLTSQLAKPESDVLLKPCCNTKCSRWANQPDHPSCCGACLSTTLEQPAHTVQCGERQELIRKAIREDWTIIIGRVVPGRPWAPQPSIINLTCEPTSAFASVQMLDMQYVVWLCHHCCLF